MFIKKAFSYVINPKKWETLYWYFTNMLKKVMIG